MIKRNRSQYTYSDVASNISRVSRLSKFSKVSKVSKVSQISKISDNKRAAKLQRKESQMDNISR